MNLGLAAPSLDLADSHGGTKRDASTASPRRFLLEDTNKGQGCYWIAGTPSTKQQRQERETGNPGKTRKTFIEAEFDTWVAAFDLDATTSGSRAREIS